MQRRPLSLLPALWALPLLAAGPALPASVHVGGNLVVAPTRLVLEGRERSTEVLVINGGDQPATFRISLTNLEMEEDGQMRALEGPPGVHSSEPFIRFTPRQVTLAAGASQTVRIQVRKPENLAPGEYRCHMLFQGVPPPEAARPEPRDAGHLSVDVRAVYGLTMPLIVRHGATHASVALSGLQHVASRDQHFATLLIHREGNRSTYGDLVATWHPEGGKPIPAGRVNGLAVYAGLPMRKVALELSLPSGRPLRGGTLKVAYLEHAGTKVLATATLALP